MFARHKKLERPRYAMSAVSSSWFKVFSERSIPFILACRGALVKGSAGGYNSEKVSYNLHSGAKYNTIVFRIADRLEFSNMIVKVRSISKDKLAARIHYCYGSPIESGSDETSWIYPRRPLVFGEGSFNAAFAINLKEQKTLESADNLFEILYRKILNAKAQVALKAL